MTTTSKIYFIIYLIISYANIYSQNTIIYKGNEKNIEIDTTLSRRIILERQKVFFMFSEQKRNEYQDLALSSFVFQKGLFEKEFKAFCIDGTPVDFPALHSLRTFFIVDIGSFPSNSTLKSIIFVKEKKIGLLYLTKLHNGNFLIDMEALNYYLPFSRRKRVLKNILGDHIIMTTKVKKINNKYRIIVKIYGKYD